MDRDEDDEQQNDYQAADPQGHGASVRAAARWLISAFAAIGAILIAGLQVRAVGTLGTDQPWRLTLALVTVCIALLAVGLVIVKASTVLIEPAITWNDLVYRETQALQKQIEGSALAAAGNHLRFDELLTTLEHGGELQAVPFTGPRDLRQSLREARRVQDPSEAQHRDRIRQLEQAANNYLMYANDWRSAQLYDGLKRVLVPAGVVLALCVVGFSWAVTPETPTTPQVTTPVAVEVYVKDTPALKDAGLNQECANKQLKGFAVGRTLSEPEVVTHRAGKCSAHRFIVFPNIGVAVPSH